MAEFWLKINYTGEDTYKVLTSIFERIFNNKLNCIQEIMITPKDKEIFIYANHNLENILGCIYKDTQLDSPDKDLITSVRVGIVGE